MEVAWELIVMQTGQKIVWTVSLTLVAVLLKYCGYHND